MQTTLKTIELFEIGFENILRHVTTSRLSLLRYLENVLNSWQAMKLYRARKRYKLMGGGSWNGTRPHSESHQSSDLLF
jgi:hypothetical protein